MIKLSHLWLLFLLRLSLSSEQLQDYDEDPSQIAINKPPKYDPEYVFFGRVQDEDIGVQKVQDHNNRTENDPDKELKDDLKNNESSEENKMEASDDHFLSITGKIWKKFSDFGKVSLDTESIRKEKIKQGLLDSTNKAAERRKRRSIEVERPIGNMIEKVKRREEIKEILERRLQEEQAEELMVAMKAALKQISSIVTVEKAKRRRRRRSTLEMMFQPSWPSASNLQFVENHMPSLQYYYSRRKRSLMSSLIHDGPEEEVERVQPTFWVPDFEPDPRFLSERFYSRRKRNLDYLLGKKPSQDMIYFAVNQEPEYHSQNVKYSAVPTSRV